MSGSARVRSSYVAKPANAAPSRSICPIAPAGTNFARNTPKRSAKLVTKWRMPLSVSAFARSCEIKVPPNAAGMSAVGRKQTKWCRPGQGIDPVRGADRGRRRDDVAQVSLGRPQPGLDRFCRQPPRDRGGRQCGMTRPRGLRAGGNPMTHALQAAYLSR
jgi:hypothetical protein